MPTPYPPLEHALILNVKLSNAHASIGDALLQLGRLPEAREAYALEPSVPFRLAGLAITERKVGNDAAEQAANADRSCDRFSVVAAFDSGNSTTAAVGGCARV
jgi:hypothetical protein